MRSGTIEFRLDVTPSLAYYIEREEPTIPDCRHTLSTVIHLFVFFSPRMHRENLRDEMPKEKETQVLAITISTLRFLC